MTTALDFALPRLDGKGEIVLRDLGARALLVVNTASECGFTPQYADLQTLWERYKGRGLVVVGVPSNDFGNQEPGNAVQIQIFCHETYAIDFPLAAKQVVLGPAAHPLFRWIVDELGEGAAPSWNFHKYLFGSGGEVAGVWPAKVRPLDDDVVREIEAVLEPSP
jgi:glutathione peroxidase